MSKCLFYVCVSSVIAACGLFVVPWLGTATVSEMSSESVLVRELGAILAAVGWITGFGVLLVEKGYTKKIITAAFCTITALVVFILLL